MKIYTRKGDDGSTGLLFGGRVAKDDPAPMAYGDVDEAQAFIGLARAECKRGSELDQLLIRLERDLWVLMSELATAPENRAKLVGERTLVTQAMVDAVETMIDATTERFALPSEFVVPGLNRVAALLDVSRTVVRRAERQSISSSADGSQIVPYLNRLSDLLWALARWQEGTSLPTRATTDNAGPA